MLAQISCHGGVASTAPSSYYVNFVLEFRNNNNNNRETHRCSPGSISDPGSLFGPRLSVWLSVSWPETLTARFIIKFTKNLSSAAKWKRFSILVVSSPTGNWIRSLYVAL